MDLSTKILGTTTVAYLQTRQKETILHIGSDTFDRASLSHVACFNFNAAHNLSLILNRDLRVKNCRDLFDRIPPEALVLPRLGAVSLAVLGAAFEALNIGGDAPLESWMRKHHAKGVKLITFDSLKLRDEHGLGRDGKRRSKPRNGKRNGHR